MQLIWRESARLNLRAITTYIADFSPDAAQDLNERIEGVAERLTLHPFMLRAGRLPGTREAVVHPNYVLVYRVTVDTVEIVSVVHSRQEYPPPSG